MKAATSDLKNLIRHEAERLGLDAFGVASVDSVPFAAERLNHFIAEGRHGTMTWMADKADRRASPRALWPDARSVIMLGQSYAPGSDPLDALAEKDRAVVSVYAQGRDYHEVVKGKIRQLAAFVQKHAGGDVKIFVDTAPLMEKPLAQAAGLGWQGKHTNLVSREHGSWLFLGAILTTAEIAPDAPEADHCGTCQRCLDICPTRAFPAPYQLDARRCLAYLSIEHKGHIPREFREAMGNRVFGCDDCLAVCPWNKFAQAAREVKFAARPGTDNPPLAEILALSDAEFRARFAGTPVKRTGRERVVRNALIAVGNSGNSQHFHAVEALLEDRSPLVRAMAVWALARLVTPEQFARLKERSIGNEGDDSVRAEWNWKNEGA